MPPVSSERIFLGMAARRGTDFATPPSQMWRYLIQSEQTSLNRIPDTLILACVEGALHVSERAHQEYQESVGAADLVRVEVLVPSARRDEIVNIAAGFRSVTRAEKARLAGIHQNGRRERICRQSVRQPSHIASWNTCHTKPRVVANALRKRGDAARLCKWARRWATNSATDADGATQIQKGTSWPPSPRTGVATALWLLAAWS